MLTLLEGECEIGLTKATMIEAGGYFRQLKFLQEGTKRFLQDPLLWKSMGMICYGKSNEAEARKALEEVLRLSPDDRQARFVLERLQDRDKK